MISTLKGPLEVEKISYVVGVLRIAPNPCLSRPCVPGQVYALKSNGVLYILAHEGKWFQGNEDFIWDNQKVATSDLIHVEGNITVEMDVDRNKYLQIELEAIEPIG